MTAISLDIARPDPAQAPGTSVPAQPAASAAPPKRSLAGATRAELAEALASIGVPEREIRMRVGQLWHWIYFRGVQDFDVMSSVGKGLRASLAERFTLARPTIVSEQVSIDGTRKWLLRMPSTG